MASITGLPASRANALWQPSLRRSRHRVFRLVSTALLSRDLKRSPSTPPMKAQPTQPANLRTDAGQANLAPMTISSMFLMVCAALRMRMSCNFFDARAGSHDLRFAALIASANISASRKMPRLDVAPPSANHSLAQNARKSESSRQNEINPLALSIVSPAERLMGIYHGVRPDFPVRIGGTSQLQARRSNNDAIHDAGQGRQGFRGGRLAG